MKLARTGIIAAAVLAVASVAFAQKPDFSGTWTVDTSAAPAPPAGGGGARGGGMAGPMVVKQTADTLTIEQTRGENKIVSTYKLDGTESVNKMTMGRGDTAREVETKSTAKWDGAKLVISTQRPGQDGAMMTQTQTWWLEGGNLVIERPGRGENPATKTVYKKTT
ncbi:MAG TPA: hypothetical protein VJ813_08235 [Vicinamibacterales bacterium]|nr:hypothetical protein [Vicinamibacterales bacterium]